MDKHDDRCETPSDSGDKQKTYTLNAVSHDSCNNTVYPLLVTNLRFYCQLFSKISRHHSLPWKEKTSVQINDHDRAVYVTWNMYVHHLKVPSIVHILCWTRPPLAREEAVPLDQRLSFPGAQLGIEFTSTTSSFYFYYISSSNFCYSLCTRNSHKLHHRWHLQRLIHQHAYSSKVLLSTWEDYVV